MARPAWRGCSSAWRTSMRPCRRRPRGSSARWPGRTPSEAILVGGRREFESALADGLRRRLARLGPRRHRRPRPRGRRPSSPRGGAGVPRRLGGRLRCRAEPQPGPRRRVPPPLGCAGRGRVGPRRRPHAGRPAHGPRRGEAAGFIARAESPTLNSRRSPSSACSAETMAATLPGRPKWILDARAAGRRVLWLADPERMSPRLGRALAAPEPDD